MAAGVFVSYPSDDYSELKPFIYIAILLHPVFCECATPNERHVIQTTFVPDLSSPTTLVVIIKGQPLQLFSWRLPTQGRLCPVPEKGQ
jgi:hypothetical protein